MINTEHADVRAALARAAARRDERNRDLVACLEAFVGAVREIPEVWIVQVDLTCGQRVLVVLDARPFDDEPRDRVYEAERASLASGEALVDFRLVNAAEYPDRPREEHLWGPDAVTLWERPAGA